MKGRAPTGRAAPRVWVPFSGIFPGTCTHTRFGLPWLLQFGA